MWIGYFSYNQIKSGLQVIKEIYAKEFQCLGACKENVIFIWVGKSKLQSLWMKGNCVVNAIMIHYIENSTEVQHLGVNILFTNL